MTVLFAARIAEFVYTVLLRPKPLRRATNFALRAMLPRTVRLGSATVVLNPADPVVSGALALSIYEPRERAFVQATCDEGTVFVDVGANVGLYTALAAHQVGASGQVVALEPDPVSSRYLEQTIASNHPERVTAHPYAATAEVEDLTLFVSESNRGDNRLTRHAGATDAIPVRGIPIDDLLVGTKLADRHLFMKIDVQGSEGNVIRGARRSLSEASRVTVLMEFWPEGLRLAGTDPAELLESLTAMGLEVSELCDRAALSAVRDPARLVQQYQGRRYTNLVAHR